MSAILQFPKCETCFDDDEAAKIVLAFDRACSELRDKGQLDMREIVARRLIAIASSGECDPKKLCERAMISVGLRKGLTAADENRNVIDWNWNAA